MVIGNGNRITDGMGTDVKIEKVMKFEMEMKIKINRNIHMHMNMHMKVNHNMHTIMHTNTRTNTHTNTRASSFVASAAERKPRQRAEGFSLSVRSGLCMGLPPRSALSHIDVDIVYYIDVILMLILCIIYMTYDI